MISDLVGPDPDEEGVGVVSSEEEEDAQVDQVDEALRRISDALNTLADIQDCIEHELTQTRLGVLINVLQHESELLLNYLNDLEITAGNRQVFVEELEQELTALKKEGERANRSCEKMNERVVVLTQAIQSSGVQMEVLDAETRRFIFVDVDGSRRIIKLPPSTDIFDPCDTFLDSEEGGVYEVFSEGETAYQLRADFASKIRRFLRNQTSPMDEGLPQEDEKTQRDRFVAILREADIQWEKVGNAYSRWFGEDTTWKALEARSRRRQKRGELC